MAVQNLPPGQPVAVQSAAEIAHRHLAVLERAGSRVDVLILTLTVIALGMVRLVASEYHGFFEKSGPERICFVIVMGILTYEFAALYRGAFPRLPGADRSLFDAGAIVQRTAQQFGAEYRATLDETLLDHIARQVHNRAQVLVIKQEESRKAFLAMLASIPFVLAILTVF